MKQYVIYHASCLDGFGAAYCAWLKYGDKAEYIAAQFGQPVPELEPDSDILVVDFSYKRPELLQLARTARSFTLLDHHKTAEEELRGLDADYELTHFHEGKAVRTHKPFKQVVFDMARSGCGLAWDFLHDAERPWWVENIEDRDIWRFRAPGTQEVHATLASLPFSFDVWHAYLAKGKDHAVMEGAAIHRYISQQAELTAGHAVEENIGGHMVPVVNANIHMSEIGHRLCQGKPFSASYFIDKKGDYVYSLRSAEDGLDVAEIAKSLGGGGHRHAAGFRVKKHT